MSAEPSLNAFKNAFMGPLFPLNGLPGSLRSLPPWKVVEGTEGYVKISKKEPFTIKGITVEATLCLLASRCPVSGGPHCPFTAALGVGTFTQGSRDGLVTMSRSLGHEGSNLNPHPQVPAARSL